MTTRSSTVLRDAIQTEADAAVRRLSRATGITLTWATDTTDAGTSFAIIWATADDVALAWVLEQGDNELWEVTAYPREVLLATAASPVLALRCLGRDG